VWSLSGAAGCVVVRCNHRNAGRAIGWIQNGGLIKSGQCAPELQKSMSSNVFPFAITLQCGERALIWVPVIVQMSQLCYAIWVENSSKLHCVVSLFGWLVCRFTNLLLFLFQLPLPLSLLLETNGPWGSFWAVQVSLKEDWELSDLASQTCSTTAKIVRRVCGLAVVMVVVLLFLLFGFTVILFVQMQWSGTLTDVFWLCCLVANVFDCHHLSLVWLWAKEIRGSRHTGSLRVFEEQKRKHWHFW